MSLFREAQNAILDIKAQGREQELAEQIKAVADAAELTGLAYKARDEAEQEVVEMNRRLTRARLNLLAAWKEIKP
jgi:tartrate dehydratase beta subunit/fumarate hydratase class I family protein